MLRYNRNILEKFLYSVHNLEKSVLKTIYDVTNEDHKERLKQYLIAVEKNKSYFPKLIEALEDKNVVEITRIVSIILKSTELIKEDAQQLAEEIQHTNNITKIPVNKIN